MIDDSPRDLGRYVLYDPIASGGMATVHFGRMHGAVGFSRLVAIKRLHQNYVTDPSFVQMFLDEARLAARLEHPNVVQTLDVVADETEVFLVMEHILGESLEAMMPRDTSRPVPLAIASAIMCGVLEGLHSAHEARSDLGEPLSIVHRDVSPHNVLVGVDGVPRVFDFGIAKAAINTTETRDGVIKGKVTYMAPEQVWGNADRRADIYAAGVILWELLAGRRRHAGEKNDTLFLKLAKNALDPLPPPTTVRSGAPSALDSIIALATAPQAEDRFADARAMAVALENAIPPAPAREVAAWIREVAGDRIERRSAVMRKIEVEVQRSKDSRPTLAEPGGTGVVTATITRAGALSSSVRPVTDSLLPALHERRRNWTMPIALLAFTAVLLLVGLRVLNKPPPAPASTARLEAQAPEAAVTVIPTPIPAVTAALGEMVDAGHPATSAAPVAPRPAWTPPPPPVRTVRAPEPSVTAAPLPAPSHRTTCDNPFTIGADGIRQVKPECL